MQLKLKQARAIGTVLVAKALLNHSAMAAIRAVTSPPRNLKLKTLEPFTSVVASTAVMV
jgi:hypothetical protein